MKKNSLVFQLKRLLDLKSFCDSVVCKQHIKQFELSENEWEGVGGLVSILDPFNKYTKKLQSNTVTLSDFIGYWTMIRIKLAKSEDELSQKLLLEMNKKQEMLMENPAMVAAIYLDPRYQRGIKDKRPLALQFLVNLYHKMNRVESFDSEGNKNQLFEDLIEEGATTDNDDDSYDDMNAYLDACDAVRNPLESGGNQPTDEEFITNLLNEFDGSSEPLQSSIWEIWEKKKDTNPELYRLATTVFSIPPTQTTVERAFSSLPIILSSHRTRLNDDTLENILIIRLNR